MKPSESLYPNVRGLKYHCRAWGPGDAPRLFLLHGWMDCSASFQFLVDALRREWRVIAPDWRGFGESEWGGGESYWYPDYLADLDVLLGQFQPQSPVNLVGHSLGGNIAAYYAGVRPQRVAKLVNVEGFGLARRDPGEAPVLLARWLDALGADPGLQDYPSLAALADRLQKGNPRLSRERAEFVARHWGREEPGRVVLRVDPRHKRDGPLPFRIDEAMACWRSIVAPVLWVEGAESENFSRHRLDAIDYAARKACFARRTEHVFPGAGHMLHHEQPERLAQLIEAFLEPA